MLPEVGVIVPLYNKEDYVLRAIESIRRQSFEDYDIVVVDDGSTDRGPEIVRSIDDSRVHLVSQENGGPGAARNRGVSHGMYSVVAFLDADDEWFDGYLERAISGLESHPECAAVVQGHVRGPERSSSDDLFGVFGEEPGVWRMPTGIVGSDVKCAVNACHTSATVCRRVTFDRYGGFYSKDGCRWAEDAYLWLQVLLGCHVFVDRRPGAWYHTESSGLYWFLDTVVPAEPALLDGDPIWENCPSDHRDALRAYLQFQTRLSMRRLAERRRFSGSL